MLKMSVMAKTPYMYLLIGWLGLVVHGCANNDTEVRKFPNLKKTNDGSIIYSPKSPVNKKFHVTVATKSFSEVEIENKNKIAEQEMNLGLEFRYQTDSAGNSSLIVTYQTIQIKMKNDGEEEVYNAVEGGESWDDMENS